MKRNVNMPNDFSDVSWCPSAPLRVKELTEILAIQFDEQALPTFNTDRRPPYAEEMIHMFQSCCHRR